MFYKTGFLRKITMAISIATLATGFFAVPFYGNAEEVELAKVRASLKNALREVSLVSNEDGRFVLPLRTNRELKTISTHCDRLFQTADPTQLIPPICGPAALSVKGYNQRDLEFLLN